jgi:hypothetical protein
VFLALMPIQPPPPPLLGNIKYVKMYITDTPKDKNERKRRQSG